jgi:phospholipid-binding lipoprotein MlaA
MRALSVDHAPDQRQPVSIHRATTFVAVAALALLAGCGEPVPSPPGDTAFDPYEAQNREVHEFNKGFDTYLVRPASEVWGALLPPPARQGAMNFATNLDTPTYVFNDILQGEVDDATHNAIRFVINSTAGIGGIFDFAGGMGLEPRRSDFDQTLYVWGAAEGPIVEVPVFGVYTSRHAYGTAVDIVTNPARLILPFNTPWLNSAAIRVVETRYALQDTIDATLYESADSYTLSRSLYLQNRRFVLAGGEAEEYFDPYEDLYGE